MQEKSKVQLAAALAATLGFAISGTANAANSGHSQLSVTNRQAPFKIASSGSDNSPALLAANTKGKEGSCKGKEGSCKGRDKGTDKGRDKGTDRGRDNGTDRGADRGNDMPGTGTGY